MKKCTSIVIVVMLILTMLAPISAVADTVQIDKKAYDAFGKTEYSANNKTTKVTGCVALRANAQAGWFIEVCDGFIGTVDIAYKISNAYYKKTVVFDGKLNEFRIGDGSGKNSLNAVKFGAIWNPIATLVLMNGVVQTMDDNRSFASAVAVLDDKILYVGSNICVNKYIGAGTEVRDLNGQMVLPGFFDSHTHAPGMHERAVPSLYYSYPTPESLVEDIRNWIEANDPEGNYRAYRFQRFNVSAFKDYKGMLDGYPDKLLLDAVSTEIPIICTDMSSHTTWVNSKAIELAEDLFDGMETPDYIAGGKIFMTPDGELTGYFSDAQTNGLRRVMNLQPYPNIPPEVAWPNYQEEANRYGITSITIAGGGSVSVWDGHDRRYKAGTQTIRVNAHYSIDRRDTGPIAPQIAEMKRIMAEGQKYNSDYQTVNTIKVNLDGVTEAGSAVLLSPYDPDSGLLPADNPDYRGEPIYTQERLDELFEGIDAAGYPLMVHCLGDGAVQMAIEALIKAMDKNGTKGNTRHQITHLTMIDQAEQSEHNDIERMAEYGIMGAMQPIWMWYNPWFAYYEHIALGDERFYKMYPLKTMYDAGIKMTGSADYSVTMDFAPLSGIEVGMRQASPYSGIMAELFGHQDDPATALRPNGPDFGVPLMGMLEFYTINGAYQIYRDHDLGSLEAGKLADIVVLEKNLFEIDPKDIAETKVMATILGGKFVYENE